MKITGLFLIAVLLASCNPHIETIAETPPETEMPPAPGGLRWNGAIAMWTTAGNDYTSFSVQLYKNGFPAAASQSTVLKYFDFFNLLLGSSGGPGSYYFIVTGIGNGLSVASDQSPVKVIDVEHLWEWSYTNSPAHDAITSGQNGSAFFDISYPDIFIRAIGSDIPVTDDGKIRLGTDTGSAGRLIIGGGNNTGPNSPDNPNPAAELTSPDIHIPGQFDLSEGIFRLTINYEDAQTGGRLLLRVFVNNNTGTHANSVLGSNSAIRSYSSVAVLEEGFLAGNGIDADSVSEGRIAITFAPSVLFTGHPSLKDAFIAFETQGGNVATGPCRITITGIKLERLDTDDDDDDDEYTKNFVYDRTQKNRVATTVKAVAGSEITLTRTNGLLTVTDHAISRPGVDSRVTIEFQPHYLDGLPTGNTHTFSVRSNNVEIHTINLGVTNTIPGANPNPVYSWYTKGLNRDVNVELRSAGGVTLTGVSHNGAALPSGSYRGTDGRFVITKEYCQTLAAGMYNLTLTFSNGDTRPFMLGIAEKSLIDYSVWELQDPTYSTGPWSAPYPRINLVNRDFTGWWYGGTGSAGGTNLTGYDIFQTSLRGYGSSGSNFIRCELRELIPNTDIKANWNPKGYHVMEVDQLIIQVNNGLSTSRTAIAQLWSATGGMFGLSVNNAGQFTYGPSDESSPSIRSMGGNGSSAELSSGNNTWSSGLAAGTPFRLRYEVKNLSFTVYFKTASLHNNEWFVIFEETLSDIRAFYFKAGNYDSSARHVGVTQWIPDWSIPHSVVAIRDIQVWHNPVTGVLQRSNGLPVTGATVSYSIPVKRGDIGGTLTTLTGTVQTDENGRYFIANVPYHATGPDPFPQAQPGNHPNDRISSVTLNFPSGGSVSTVTVPERTTADDIYTVATVVYP